MQLMENILLISLAFSIGFFIASIFGFAGMIISTIILNFFLDIKEAILLGAVIGPLSNLILLGTDHQSFSKSLFIKIFIPALPGVILGAYLIDIFSSFVLLKVFSIFLIAFSGYQLIGKIVIINKFFKSIFLFIAGFFQGMFSTGAPFIVMSIFNDFKNKGEFRSTISVFYLVFGIIRLIQFYIQDTYDFNQIDYYYIVIILIPVTIFILLGHKIHVKISENVFKKGIAVILFISGVIFLFK